MTTDLLPPIQYSPEMAAMRAATTRAEFNAAQDAYQNSDEGVYYSDLARANSLNPYISQYAWMGNDYDVRGDPMVGSWGNQAGSFLNPSQTAAMAAARAGGANPANASQLLTMLGTSAFQRKNADGRYEYDPSKGWSRKNGAALNIPGVANSNQLPPIGQNRPGVPMNPTTPGTDYGMKTNELPVYQGEMPGMFSGQPPVTAGLPYQRPPGGNRPGAWWLG